MYINRKIEAQIRKYLKKPEVIALIGPRQAGKTTVLKKIHESLDKSVFISFEDKRILGLFENEINQFASMYIEGQKYLFIDEFQYASKGGKLLKYLYDHYDTKIIVSGSSSAELTIEAIKFLVGRVIVLEMYPLDFEEFLGYKNPIFSKLYKKNKINLKRGIRPTILHEVQYSQLEEYFSEYTIWGGYPRVVLEKNHSDKEKILKNIYNTYFLREIHEMLGLIDDYKFSQLIEALALQIGNLVSYQEIAQLSGLSFETIKKYIHFLTKTYIVDLLRPFYTNKRKEIIKNPKVYFFDTGLRNAIVQDFRPLKRRPDNGALLENAVFMQMYKKDYRLNYWRDKNQNEIDFIIDIGEQKKIAMEIKYRAASTKNFPQSFIQDHPKIKTLTGFLKGDLKSPREKSFFIGLL